MSHRPARFLGERGNLAVVLTAIVAGVMIMYTGVSSLLLRLTEMNIDTTRKYAYQSTLSSLMSYTRAGIKARWCFTDRWDQDSPVRCDLTHPRSVERLLLTDTQLTFINAMIAKNPSLPHGNPIPLQEFSTTINARALDANHPLTPVFKGKDFDWLDKIDLRIARNSNQDLPVVGAEIHLRIEITLHVKSGRTTPSGTRQMKGWNEVTVFPRELSAFSLLVAGNLYLDGTLPKDPGDVALQPVPVTTSGGLIFESPVFVNHNVHIPSGQNLTDNAFVTFADSFVLGRGVLKQGDAGAVTSSAGGVESQFYTSIKGFGGFQRGVKIDGAEDRGLDIMSGRVTGRPVDTSLFNNCVDRNLVKYDLKQTADAALLVKALGADTWRFSWSRDDYFRTKGNNEVQLVNDFYNSPSIDVLSGSSKAVAQITVNFTTGARTARATVKMPRHGAVELKPRLIKKAVDASGAEKTAAQRIEAAPGTVRIETLPVVVNGRAQDNQLDLRITVSQPGNLLGSFKATMTGFDVAVGARDASEGTLKPGYSDSTSPHDLNWNDEDADPFVGDPKLTNNYGPTWARADGDGPKYTGELRVNEDWAELEEKCDPSQDSGSGYTFKPSDWDADFSDSTRFAWSVNPPAASVVRFDATNAYWRPGMAAPAFALVTIAEVANVTHRHPVNCVVTAEANFLTGFFVCDSFTIQARSSPLRVIGTVIASRLTIDPTAISAGIRWSNIHHPNAVLELRRAGVLRPLSAANCDPRLDQPVWHPYPTMAARDDRYKCNPISLRNQMDPMRWTSVDPDCGLLSGDPATTCKNRAKNYVVKEIDKGFSL